MIYVFRNIFFSTLKIEEDKKMNKGNPAKSFNIQKVFTKKQLGDIHHYLGLSETSLLEDIRKHNV